MTKRHSLSFSNIVLNIILTLISISAFARDTRSLSKLPASDSVVYYMKKVADWQWENIEHKGWKYDQKDWTNAAMYVGMLAWAKATNDDSYFQKLIKIGNDTEWRIGKRRHHADDYAIGQLYAQLYSRNKNPLYIADFQKLADTLVLLPHTESLEWGNNIGHREWAWCDALFMGPPALGYLSQATGDQKYLNKAIKLWWKTSDFLYSKPQHLFFRDSRYFDKKEKNGKDVFWSRGNGWVIAAMANLLSVMPSDHPEKKRFIKQFKQMAEKIASLQQADGTWHASLLDPASYPIKETSGTSFFCYALAWGINQKILSYKSYYPVVQKAWVALKASVQPDGKLGFVQPIGAAPDMVRADHTEVYGVGAFLLAGTELLKLQGK